MSVNWTDEQKRAIETHGGNILVAAAAGSGKTAVLVERVIRMITDTENPVSVDNLLVLTFTDAAAAEMKRKISAAIDKKLEENPDDDWLREQSIKVGSAAISTIHSFCSRIIGNNVHLTDLPADFSLIDTTENEVLRAKALDTVLESYYSKIDIKPAFKELVTGWGGIKGDENLREIILSMHKFSLSLAYPKRWFRNTYKGQYHSFAEKGLKEGSHWRSLVEKEIYNCCVSITDSLEIMWKIAENEFPQDSKHYAYYFDMKSDFCDRFAVIKESDDNFDALCGLVSRFEIKRIPPKNADIDESVLDRLNILRDGSVKVELKRAKELLSAFDEENIVHMASCSPIIRTLFFLVRGLEKVHQKYKREKSAIDFNDLEHGLLRLLCDGAGRETPLCEKLRAHYHEILLDEFQDTNNLQFEIFRRLSKPEGNLFMVGDVKQCIYKFRAADPSIFMGLYRAYDKGEGGQLIRLFKNFRSRREIVDGVNDIFSSVMSEKVGGIDYTKEEYLINGATYKDGDCYDTEILLTDASKEKTEDSLLEGVSKEEIEAINVVNRMTELVFYDKISVTDKDTNSLRPARLGDIAVLCRNKKECGIIEAELINRGISARSESGQHYLDSIEVTTVLSFLQIIDNPMQDIPLIAVMRSALFGFTAEELAFIRACEKGRFYNAVFAAAKENQKAADFVAVLDDFRACAKYMGTDELVWKICNELHYFSIVGAMPGGELRKENLKLLLARCSDYERGSLAGLFNFMRYIETLRENDEDLAPAKEASAQENCVKIMTIHKSKGLEFPIVFLVGTTAKFIQKDIQGSIIWDEKFGVGIDYVDTRQRVRFNLPLKALIEGKMLSSLKAEEMRLLYVAMTRAKEKLIISAALIDRDNKWSQSEYDKNGRIYSVLADKIICMRDWVLSAVLNHEDGSALREYSGRTDIIPRLSSDAKFKVYFADVSSQLPVSFEIAEIENQETEEFDIEERLSYTYKFSGLGNIPIKMSVSELKRRRMPEEDFSTNLIEARAELATGKDDISRTEVGTITHFVLQHIDIKDTDSYEQIRAQVDKMAEDGAISKIQKDAVDIDSIAKFFDSPLGKRLKASEKFEREFDFYMLIPPTDIDARMDCEGAQDVLLQGIADCFFYEDNKIILIDYKTDRVGKGGVVERSRRYRLQIDYYAKGIEEIMGVPVSEKYLYFLNCSEAVAM